MEAHILCNSFPYPLYKSFDCSEWANEFVENGSIWIRSLDYYLKIEDPNRQDNSGDQGRLVIPKERLVIPIDKKGNETSRMEKGPVYYSTRGINPCFILCFSGPEVDLNYHTKKYGEHRVRVNQPDKLVSDIASYLRCASEISGNLTMKSVKVRYDKGLSVAEEPPYEERIALAYNQKLPKDSCDCEYRLVLKFALPFEKQELIKVKLHKKLDYAEIM